MGLATGIAKRLLGEGGLEAWDSFRASTTASRDEVVGAATISPTLSSIGADRSATNTGSDSGLRRRLTGHVAARADAGRRGIEDGASGRNLAVGQRAPAFALPGLHGETLTLNAMGAGQRSVLLVFTDPDCAYCNDLMPELGGLQREQAATVTVAFISRGPAAANRAKTAPHRLANVLVQRDDEVARTYSVTRTPSSILVDPAGNIASALAEGVEAVREMAGSVSGECTRCVEECAERGGGDACRSICQLGRLCP